MQLKIGDGSLTVSATINALVFKQIDAHYEIGTELDGREYSDRIVNAHTIQFQTYMEVQELKQLLKNSYENNVFVFKDVKFDLTNYQRKSVDCIIDQLTWIEQFLPRTQIV